MTSPVPSVAKAFAILRILADSDALSLSDICRLVGVSPSSCLNLLKTLVGEGAIERDARTKLYRLTPAWQTADALRQNRTRQLVDRAQPAMARFAQTHETAVGLWRIASRDRMQLVAHAQSDAGMRLALADDQRQPLGAGAAGRAIAAAQAIDEAELARRFAPVRWQYALTFAAYAEQVADAAARGFGLDRGHAHRGVHTVAAAITGVAPGFCLTASFVVGSRPDDALDDIGGALAELGKQLAAA